jgi:3-hydroxyisobutyrate dehydrogenase-like beta-hydroxyacid dehydrogenase
MSGDGKSKRVGLIGTGLMGMALAKRLLGAGFEVIGYDVDAARRGQFAALGGHAVAQPDAVAQACSRILLAVFNTEQVEQVLDGLIAAPQVAQPDRLVLSVVTCDPDRLAALARRVASQGVLLLETPVSGTSEQVARGDGVGLMGGEHILDVVFPRRFHIGPAGSGGRAKLAINLILGLNRLALAEGLVFAERMGLDTHAFLEVARASAAYSQIMDVKGGKMLARDYSAHGKIAQALKDVHLMLEQAQRLGQELPLAQVNAEVMQACVRHGEGEWDNCAVIEEIRRRGK